jgi:exosortase/archaeosortase family protein
VPSNTGEISSFVIGAPCAGVYSILAFSLFAGLLIYITHGKNYQKIMIVLTGLILVYILNVFRLVSLVTIAYFLGSGTAWQTFHFLGGSILFVIGLVVTLLLSDKIGLKLKTRIKQRKPCLFCEDAIQKNEKFCLTCGKVFQPPETKIRVNIFAIKIAAVILIVFLIVTITMPLLITQETPEGPLIIKSQKGSQPLLPSSEGWAPTYRGKLILDFPRMVVYNYYYSQSGKPNLVLVRLDVTTGEYPLHGVNTWPICTGWSLEMMKDIMLYGIQVPARFFALYDSSSGTQNVVLCWIKKLTDAPKYMRVNLYTDTRRLVQYGLISNYNDYDKAFSVLLDLARSIEQYWQNATQASFISKLFLENWPIWLALSVALIWLICYINWTRSKLEEERRTIKFEKLSEYEKQVYREIKNCSPSSNLLKIYLENRIRLVKFQETLKKLQEENLIGTDILVKDDIFLETIYPKPIKNE